MSEYSPRSRELASELRQKALRNLGTSHSQSAASGRTVTKRDGGGDGTTKAKRAK